MTPSAGAPSTWLRLPLAFDVARMQRECDQFADDDWISHFNTGVYDNGWSCLPLRSAGLASFLAAITGAGGAYGRT